MSADPAAPAGPAGASVPVLLLRHGQSEWNAVRHWQGTADPPLTPLGREQAIETAWTLAALPEFGGLWSSTLVRARDTAAIIGDALALGAPRPDARLVEAGAGEWQGLTPEEIEATWPGWLAEHRRPAGFEPYHEVVARAVAALHDIADEVSAAAAGRTVPAALAVSHSGVIRSLIRHLGRDDDRVPNLGGVWLRVTTTGAGNGTSATGRPSVVPFGGATADGIALVDLFDPAGIVISGVDAPGEDPGDEPDQADADRGPEH